MRNWISLSPAAVFFGAYLFSDSFQVATAALMVAVVVQIGLLKFLGLKINGAEWTAAVLILVFGSITLILRDTVYLQIKTTVLNWLFAIALLVADFAFRKNLVQLALGQFLDAPAPHWRRASCALAAMFFAIGAINLAVMFNASEETWVWVKTFAYPAINFIVVAAVIGALAVRGNVR